MKDPSRNPALEASFSFTGVITDIERVGKKMQVQVHQDAAEKFPTDYKLVIPLSALQNEEFPYAAGDTVMIQDALLYTKDSEIRLRTAFMDQVSATTAQQGELNALSFSGEIVEVKEEAGYTLVLMKQTYRDKYTTILEVIIPSSVRLEQPPKAGDIGYIRSAILYEKEGGYRAKITRNNTYKVLYSPDAVMCLGTIEAREKFI